MRHQQNGLLYEPYTYEACIYEQSIHERFIYEPSVYEPRRTFTAGGREEAEMRLYRLLGVKRFRRFVFALEAGKHRRDGGRNANYHLADLSCAGMRRHFAFLSYNAIIHIAGLLLAVLLILAKAFVLHKWRPVDWGIPAAVLLNIYCIMLQRYNSLRIRKALRARQKIRGRRIRKNALLLVKSRPAERTAGDSVFSERDSNPQDHDCGPEEWTPGTDIVFLQDLKTAIREGRDFVVREEDAETIGRLADWACRAGVLCEKNGRDNPSIGKTFGEEAGKEPARGEKNDGAGLYSKASKAPKTLKASEVSKVSKALETSEALKASEVSKVPKASETSEALKASEVSKVPKASETSEALKAPKTSKASKAEIWTDRLQRLAGRKHDRILRKFSVVTPGKRGEQAFNRLFPSASEDAVEERVDMFLLAEEMLSGEG